MIVSCLITKQPDDGKVSKPHLTSFRGNVNISSVKFVSFDDDRIQTAAHVSSLNSNPVI